MAIESIRIKRAESLSEEARKKYDITDGFVKIVTTRGSPAKTEVKRLNKLPAVIFREIMRK